jgi:2'-5' RNA ligase
MRTRDHWAATAHLWTHGDAVLTWHFTFDGQPAVHALARLAAPALAHPFFDVVPPRWLHLTTQGVGLDSDVDVDERTRIVAAATRLLRPVATATVTIGPPRLFDEGVVLPAEDDGKLQAVRLLLQDADASVRGRDRVPDWRVALWPHVTLAYANAEADAGDLVLPGETASITLRDVCLIRLRRSRGLYSWETLATVPLRG